MKGKNLYVRKDGTRECRTCSMHRGRTAHKQGQEKSVIQSEAACIANHSGHAQPFLERSLVLVNPREPKEGELAALAKDLLLRDLIKPPRTIRERLALCRTGLECDGVIGPRSTEVHLHQHAALPPVVQQMLEDKMREILQQREAIDGEVSAGEGEGQKRP